jgi:HEAT repeat protein
MMVDAKYLMDDDMMRDFIVNGYVNLKPEHPKSLHDAIYEKTTAVIEEDGNPGNNLLPRIPEIQKIYDHPSVVGALTSILGPSYVMHAHRHPHVNPPHSRGGGWHKDSYWGHKKVRDHHPRWIMAMYYPQDTPIEIGPTGIIPGSQYFETRVESLNIDPQGRALDPEGIGLPGCGEAGTIILIHFDLWHRGFPNQTDKTRYMMKFQFTRMDEPDKPCWNNRRETIDLNGLSDHPRAAQWTNMWDWLSGHQNQGTKEINSKDKMTNVSNILDESEEIRMHAAYNLATLGEEGLLELIEALQNENNEVKREAGYGLSALGSIAIPALIKLLTHEDEHVRGYAVYAMGDMGRQASDAIPHLIPLIDDPSPMVRQNLSDALGQINRMPESSVKALIKLMGDEDGQVRYNTAYALGKFGHEAQAAIPVLSDAYYDENRYVQGHAAIALEQIGTPEALQTLLHQLQANRWCPLTTNKSTF